MLTHTQIALRTFNKIRTCISGKKLKRLLHVSRSRKTIFNKERTRQNDNFSQRKIHARSGYEHFLEVKMRYFGANYPFKTEQEIFSLLKCEKTFRNGNVQRFKQQHERCRQQRQNCL